MKKILIFLLAAGGLFPLAAETGTWRLEPLFTRLEEGTLILPDRPYSEPYAGISRIRFIDDYLAVLTVKEQEIRVFYEMIPGDADNFRFLLTFRNGETLSIRLVRDSGTRYLFEYSLPPDFFDPAEPAVQAGGEGMGDSGSTGRSSGTGADTGTAGAAGMTAPAGTPQTGIPAAASGSAADPAAGKSPEQGNATGPAGSMPAEVPSWNLAGVMRRL